MLEQLRPILEMIRFSHTLFALPFALLSAALAWYQIGAFRVLDLMGILACMVFARSAAMAFNRIVDRDIDARNPRTAQRHLPSGRLSVHAVATFTLICSLGFILSTTIFLAHGNPWPLYLSVPVLLFVFAYSFTKRFTALAHFWLGASLLLAPLSAWVAIVGMHQLKTPFVLGLAVLFWVAGFDILYACQDADFDRKARLHSIPARIGIAQSLRAAAICHFAMVCLLVVLWLVTPALGQVFMSGVIGVAVLLAYEHSLVKPNDLSRVNEAFFHINSVISVGLFLVVLLQIAVNLLRT